MGRSRVAERPAWIRRAADHPQTGPLLLDTHIWVWYLAGDRTRISDDLLSLLNQAAADASLYVADISYWEVAVKSAKGHLGFSIEPTVWLKRAVQVPGIRLLPLTRDILLLSTRLPGVVHNDPADRMLLATAALHSLPLVSADHLLIEYASAQPGTAVIDARP